MTEKLSDHFTYDEMVVSEKAARLGLSNVPPPKVRAEMVKTAQAMEAVRDIVGRIHVNSCYRAPAVNKVVGGSTTSAHCKGYAVDFIAPDFGAPLAVCQAIVKAGIKFDQLIWEGTWVHISFDPRLRGQKKTNLFDGKGLIEGIRGC